MSGLSNYYTSPFRLWNGPTLFVMVDNAEDAETILSSQHCYNKQDCYKYVREGISYDGLFTCDGKSVQNPQSYIHIPLNYICFFVTNSDQMETAR